MRYILGLILFLSVAYGQINDKNFKEKVNGGVTVAVFTSEWQEQDLDEKILKGVDGYQDAEILIVKSEDAPKVVKKLRFRNFPSIALFFDGSKKETWKADMDGEVDCSSKEIRNAMIVSVIGFIGASIYLTDYFENHGLWFSLMFFMILRALTLKFYFNKILRKF